MPMPASKKAEAAANGVRGVSRDEEGEGLKNLNIFVANLVSFVTFAHSQSEQVRRFESESSI